MSTNRTRRDDGHRGKGPNGRNLCRQCGTEVPKGRRRTFCSEECVHRFRLTSDPGYVRHLVFARDKGICALCGLDTVALNRRRFLPYVDRPGRMTEEEWRGELRRLGYPVNSYVWRDQSLWQADHIVPVVEGGGECDLDNYRTLCVPCHHKATAALAARRAAKRQAIKEADLAAQREAAKTDYSGLPLFAAAD